MPLLPSPTPAPRVCTARQHSHYTDSTVPEVLRLLSELKADASTSNASLALAASFAHSVAQGGFGTRRQDHAWVKHVEVDFGPDVLTER